MKQVKAVSDVLRKTFYSIRIMVCFLSDFYFFLIKSTYTVGCRIYIKNNLVEIYLVPHESKLE